MSEAIVSERRKSSSSRAYALMCRLKLSCLRSAGFSLCFLLGFALTARGQSAGTFDTGTIVGSVTDQTGAVIPHASVTIANTGTGNVTTAKTGDNGLFTVPALPFGNYVVSASADRFGKAASKTFVLNVGATARVDLKLSIAGVSENVQVTGTMATVNLSTATAGTTLNENQIQNLPTNGRDVMDFLNIAPGSVNSTGLFQGSINGQENFMTGIQVTLDGQNASRPDISGFDETEGAEANRMTRASIDSIQEIDFANSGYSADVGHSLGPQMNIIQGRYESVPWRDIRILPQRRAECIGLFCQFAYSAQGAAENESIRR